MIAAIVTYEPGNGKSAAEISQALEAGVPAFTGLPGLITKYFCFDDEAYRGTSVYIWESRAAADACFGNPAFMDRFRATFGCDPEITFTDVKAIADNR